MSAETAVVAAVAAAAQSAQAAQAAHATQGSASAALQALPMPLQLLVAALLVVGAFFLLVGSVGLLRFRDVLQRLHAPTKASTLGLGGLLLASMVLSWTRGEAGVHELLITLFVFITAPVGAMLMAQAAMHRQEPGVPPLPAGGQPAFEAEVASTKGSGNPVRVRTLPGLRTTSSSPLSNDPRAAFLEFLRNFSPQISILALAIVVWLITDLNRLNQSTRWPENFIAFVSLVSLFFVALVANVSQFLEKSTVSSRKMRLVERRLRRQYKGRPAKLFCEIIRAGLSKNLPGVLFGLCAAFAAFVGIVAVIAIGVMSASKFI